MNLNELHSIEFILYIQNLKPIRLKIHRSIQFRLPEKSTNCCLYEATRHLLMQTR